MTFKHRIITNAKILRKNRCIKCAKRIAILFASLGIVWIMILQMKLWNLSKLKSITETYRDELKLELKKLSIEEESRDSWRTLDVENSRIFSAYLETRPEVVLEEDDKLIYLDTVWAFIRIIGILPVSSASIKLTCNYRYTSTITNKAYILKKPSIRTELVAFGENFGMAYCPVYILCPLPYPNEVYPVGMQLPVAVTVSINPNRPIDSLKTDEFVTIRYPGLHHENYERQFSVCLQPLHHQFDKTNDLIAFIEYYRMMGVNRFTFYRDSATPDVDKVLDYYKSMNIAIVIQWKLLDFYEFERDLRVDGIFAALNDCLYRSTTYGYRYIIGVDVDEYIVPRKHDNFTNMMEYLNPKGHGSTGAWIFRNVFYYLMYDDDAVTLSSGTPKMNFHGKTRRWELVNPSHDRSKFIVQGRDVVELGNHRVWKWKRTWLIFRRYKETTVDPEIGTSNHYRYCETEIEKCWQRKTILDRTAHRFTRQLGQRVEHVYRRIFSDHDG